MGKAKKRKLEKHASKPYAKKPKPSSSTRKASITAKPQPPTIPFDPANRILLVGEGDFSFSRSLLEHHGCANLLATSYDSHDAILAKYPQAVSHIHVLEAEEGCKILSDIDATKLGRVGAGAKDVRKGGFDRVVFNFPHVGGLTKDVNRQVRHNQELLVGFFKSALPLLAPAGSIVVTIFEGEPYELWNIRDLARHAGLRVGRSFRFQAIAYPGYRHARTLGNIEGGGGWKGEDRPARTYIFELNDGGQAYASTKKKSGHESDSDND